MKADANAEDHIMETRLHYTALTGQWTCAKILPTHGAKSDAVSSFGETPLEVADQAVVEYLGVNTNSVVKLLSLGLSHRSCGYLIATVFLSSFSREGSWQAVDQLLSSSSGRWLQPCPTVAGYKDRVSD